MQAVFYEKLNQSEIIPFPQINTTLRSKLPFCRRGGRDCFTKNKIILTKKDVASKK